MKKRYDVGEWLGMTMRFNDQREAFELAKKIAAQDKFGESIMIELVWNEKGILSNHTVAVRADGTYRKIN